MRRWLRAVGAVLVTVSVCAGVGIGSVAPAYAGATINGGGSGFAALEIDQWRADTARAPFDLSVNYVAQGSSFGRQQFTQGTVDFGASDIQYVSSDAQPNRPFVYVPVSAGGVAFMYNLQDSSGNKVTSLRLTRDAVCRIFTGLITKWNDPEIVRSNPSFASFNRSIHAVVRADGAGESFVLSEFCISVDPGVWSAFVKQQKASPNSPNLLPEFLSGQPVSSWPSANWGPNNDVNPVSIPYADGTANYVADPSSGPNSITYVAAGYAKVREAPTASVQNAAGFFTQPDEQNVTDALAYATPRGNGTFKLAYSGAAPTAYFPSTYSYILSPASVTGAFGADKGAALAQFLCYAVSQGQVIAPQLRYARLSSQLVDIAENAIVRIPGAPAKRDCFVKGAPPPPPPPVVPGGSNSGSGGSGSLGGGAGSVSGGTGGSQGPASNTSQSGSGASQGSTTGSANGTSAGPKTAGHGRSAQSRAEVAAANSAQSAAIAQAKLDAELSSAASGTGRSGGGGSTLWIIALGVGVAAAFNAVSRLRKRSV